MGLRSHVERVNVSRQLDELDQADRILVCGEASSHCVSASVRHLFEHLPGGALERVTLLTDAMSPVAGFQDQHEALLREAVARGARLSTTAELMQN